MSKTASEDTDKAMLVIEIKGYSPDDDWTAIEAEIRKIEQPGLKWGEAKVEPVAFGVKQLVISLTINGETSVEDLETTIEDMEDIQSMVIRTFNKR